MGLTGWDGANYLLRSSQIVSTYPFVISAWVHRVTTANQKTICEVGLTGQPNHRRVQFRIDPSQFLQLLVYDNSAIDSATASATIPASQWSHAGGEAISTTSRAALVNGANRVSNATSVNPSASDRFSIGTALNGEPIGTTDGIAEVSLWDGSGMSNANMDSLIAKLYNGGAAGAGG